MAYAKWGEDSDVYVCSCEPGLDSPHNMWSIQPRVPKAQLKAGDPAVLNLRYFHSLGGVHDALVGLELQGFAVPSDCWDRIYYELESRTGLLSGKKVIVGDEN